MRQPHGMNVIVLARGSQAEKSAVATNCYKPTEAMITAKLRKVDGAQCPKRTKNGSRYDESRIPQELGFHI